MTPRESKLSPLYLQRTLQEACKDQSKKMRYAIGYNDLQTKFREILKKIQSHTDSSPANITKTDIELFLAICKRWQQKINTENAQRFHVIASEILDRAHTIASKLK